MQHQHCISYLRASGMSGSTNSNAWAQFRVCSVLRMSQGNKVGADSRSNPRRWLITRNPKANA
eukprot:1777021-Pyramimonas_sp.AAC.1